MILHGLQLPGIAHASGHAATPVAVPSPAPSVLVLVPESPHLQPLSGFVEAVTDQLTAENARAVVLTEFLPSQVDRRLAIDWMNKRFSGVRFDAVVVYGAPQLAFALEARAALWGDIPIVFGGVSAANMPSLDGQRAVYGQIMQDGIEPTLRLASQLFPGPRHMAVLGPEPGDPMRPDFWELVDRHHAQLVIERLVGLDDSKLRQRIASLPPGSLLALTGPVRDAGTQQIISTRTMRELLALSPVPVFSGTPELFGRGIVGGAEYSATLLGTGVGRLLVRILLQRDPPSEPVTPASPPIVRVDWRVAERLDIDSRRIPATAVVEFRPPDLWDAYRVQVLVGVGVLLLQSSLLAALLFERRQRRRAQRDATQRLAELAHQQRLNAVGALSLTLAHELNQPLGAILANAETVEVLLERDPVPRAEVRDALDRIHAANGFATRILANLRRMVRKMPQPVDLVAVDDLLADTALMLRPEAQRRQVQFVLRPGAPGIRVRADRAQLEQVILNLALNAMDAMQDTPQSMRMVEVSSSFDAAARKATVTVLDRGHGLDASQAAQVFDSFHTTKPDGLGLGLSIAKGLVQGHGGSLQAAAREGGGARFSFQLPAILEQPEHTP